MIEEKKYISSKILFSAISEQLGENRQVVFTVTGMSMWPFLCHGRDQVIVEKIDRKSLKIGDIILFRVCDERYILHRITQLGEVFFQTTGDGNMFRDPEMPCNCIVAKVCRIIRKGKIIDCKNFGWKALSYIWMILFPVRKQLFNIWFSIRQMLN